jgi:sulfite exporter TauE/SafE
VAALVVTVFVSSLLGSLHCAGMCGGFVTFYAGADVSHGLARIRPHLAYNLGRLATYAVLGAASGAAGAALDRAGALAGIGRAASILAGTVMVVWGGVLLLQARGARIPTAWVPRGLSAFVGRRVAALADRPPTVRALALGLLSTLLPCGWLYAFAVLAAGTGHAGLGALTMVAFWAGTLPVMASLGAGIQVLAGPLRRHLPVVTSAALIVVGLLAIVGRATPARADGAAGDPPAATTVSCPMHPEGMTAPAVPEP